MNVEKIFCLLFSIFFCAVVHAEPIKKLNPDPIVAVGAFRANDKLNSLIIASGDNGEQWSFVPTDTKDSLSSVSCYRNQCTAIARSWISNGTSIYSSNDPEHAWQINTNIADLPTNDVELTSLSCDANICNAAGYTSVDGARITLFSLRSEDSGQTWKYSKMGDLAPYVLPQRFKIHCTGQTCVAVATVAMTLTPPPIGYPVIFVSSDAGRVWSRVTTIKNFPSGDIGMKGLLNVNCNITNCIAVGFDISAMATSKPFILKSDDVGKTWKYVKNVYGLIPQVGNLYVLSHVTCADKLCVAGGARENLTSNSYDNKPLLLVSWDGGESWNYSPVPISHSQSNEKSTEIHSLSCVGANCVVVGEGQNIFILSTKNGGINWTVTQTIPGTPADFSRNARLRSLTCQDKNCIIAGVYDNYELKKTFPFFLISQDAGMTWQFKKDIAHLPDAESYYLDALTGSKNDGFANQAKSDSVIDFMKQFAQEAYSSRIINHAGIGK